MKVDSVGKELIHPQTCVIRRLIFILKCRCFGYYTMIF